MGFVFQGDDEALLGWPVSQLLIWSTTAGKYDKKGNIIFTNKKAFAKWWLERRIWDNHFFIGDLATLLPGCLATTIVGDLCIQGGLPESHRQGIPSLHLALGITTAKKAAQALDTEDLCQPRCNITVRGVLTAE